MVGCGPDRGQGKTRVHEGAAASSRGQVTVMASLIGGSLRSAVRCRAAPFVRASGRLPIRRSASGLGGQGGGSHNWIIAAGVGVAGITTFAVSWVSKTSRLCIYQMYVKDNLMCMRNK